MSVPLASLGTFVYEGGRGQIMRKDQKRVITITGNSQGRGSDKVLADVRARVSAMRLPRVVERFILESRLARICCTYA